MLVRFHSCRSQISYPQLNRNLIILTHDFLLACFTSATQLALGDRPNQLNRQLGTSGDGRLGCVGRDVKKRHPAVLLCLPQMRQAGKVDEVAEVVSRVFRYTKVGSLLRKMLALFLHSLPQPWTTKIRSPGTETYRAMILPPLQHIRQIQPRLNLRRHAVPHPILALFPPPILVLELLPVNVRESVAVPVTAALNRVE